MWSDNESKEDLLGFQYLAQAVISIVKNETLLPATIGVFGDWGGGKSTLIEIVRAQLTTNTERKAGTVVLSFNGWLFEGYEGAKTALMGTILEELQENETFKNKASDKAKKLIKSLFRRINWMKATLGVGKLVGGHFAGPAAPALWIGGAGDLLSVAKEAAKKAEEIDPEKLKDYVKEEDKQADDGDSETRRQIQNFRKDFEELLKESSITRLVITIDDLDRCSPDTIIPTLEAIKLFLFVPRTAFIIGADEELVRYAVRRRFPELPGDRREVGRDYLEKLIQFPIRIPALGRAEVESYMGLLFVTTCAQLTPEQKGFVHQRVGEAGTDALMTASFNTSIAREILKPLPQALEDDLGMVERIAPLLGTIMNGNPRQCKRFLNMLLLRLEMARSKGITLKQRVLAKLMLLEYFRMESFRRLAEIQFAQDGTPKELGQMEKVVRTRGDHEDNKNKEEQPESTSSGKKVASKVPKTNDTGELSSEFTLWTADPWIREWLLTEPPLAGEDLRAYFFFSRDNLGLLGTAGQRLSVAARGVLDKLKSTSKAVRVAGLTELKGLGEADANAVFEALSERTKREEDLGADNASLKSMIDAAQERPNLLQPLIAAVKMLPEKALPVWTPVSIQNACKGHTDAQGAFKEILITWSKSTANTMLASAAKSTLESARGTG
jgi:predicted KAP-like P-loop ATPase